MNRPLIAILRGLDPEQAGEIGRAIYEAGITVLEVPLNSPQPIASISALSQALPDAIIGAGTVLTCDDVKQVFNAGGQIIVSPNCDPEVIATTLANGMQSWPGVFTPSECFTAIKSGATGLKLFPGSIAGPSGLKAIKAVLPSDIPVYTVGGAGPDNFEEWLKAGADGFGIGTAIYQIGDTVDTVKDKAHLCVEAYDKAVQSSDF